MSRTRTFWLRTPRRSYKFRLGRKRVTVSEMDGHNIVRIYQTSVDKARTDARRYIANDCKGGGSWSWTEVVNGEHVECGLAATT